MLSTCLALIAAVHAEDTPLAIPVTPDGGAAAPTDAAAPAPAAATPSPAPAAPEQNAEQLYLAALAAWKDRNFTRALQLATDATNRDPLMSEAWLLRSYAHMRLDEEAKALASVRLARESEREDVRAAARSLEARLTQVYVRDSPSVYTGVGGALELQYGDPKGRVVFNFGVGVPIISRLSVAAEIRWIALDPGELQVAGTRAATLVSWAIPVGSGRWTLNPAVGPAIWIAAGDYWQDGANPYLGLQAQVALDGRLTPAFGLYIDAGTQVYPGQLADLSWYVQPIEGHTGLRLWFWGL